MTKDGQRVVDSEGPDRSGAEVRPLSSLPVLWWVFEHMAAGFRTARFFMQSSRRRGAGDCLISSWRLGVKARASFSLESREKAHILHFSLCCCAACSVVILLNNCRLSPPVGSFCRTNLLKPTGYVTWCTSRFNVYDLFILTRRIDVFWKSWVVSSPLCDPILV
jgi:hypothetical protein